MDNIIKIFLRETGGIAELSKTIPLYVGMYNTAILDVYVPNSLVSESISVKVGAILTANDGTKATTDSIPMTFKENASVYNQNYAIFELNPFPANFLTYAGIQDLIVNIVTLDDEEVESVVTTQIAKIDVLDSSLIPDETLSTSAVDQFNARITVNEQNISTNTENIGANTEQIAQNVLDIAQNSQDIADIQQNYTTNENPVGSITVATLTGIETTLNNYVQQVMSRAVAKGDVVMVTLEISGQTDEIYKYFYTASGWKSLKMPAFESASNTDKGIIQGTLGENKNTQVDIAGGKINAVYVKDNNGTLRDTREYINTNKTSIDNIISGTTKVGYAQKTDNDANNNNIIDTYLTKNAGVTKTEMRDYALPREFNDIFYLGENDTNQPIISENMPEQAITFTKTIATIGTYDLIIAEYVSNANFELSKKNSYQAVFYISANTNTTVQFRLDLIGGGSPITLNTELSNEIVMTANNIYKVQFNANFNEIDNVYKYGTDGGLQVVLSVVSTSSASVTYTIYQNSTYISSFNLNTNKYTINIQQGELGEIPSISVDGYEIDAGTISFEMYDDLNLLKNNTLVAFKLAYSGTSLDKYLQLVDEFGGEEYHLKTPYNTSAFNDRPKASDLKQTRINISSGVTTIEFIGLVKVIEGYGTTIIVQEDDLSAKLDKNLGGANSGKFLQVNSSGEIVPVAIDHENDVIEGYYYNDRFYADAQHEQMLIGERGKIYIDLVSNREYRYDGTNYVVLTALIDDTQESSTTTYSSYKMGQIFVLTANNFDSEYIDELMEEN